MAITIHVAGACLAKIDANQGSGLESLGYTVNGAEIEERDYHSDVPGDQNGGEEGPPIDVQYFGAVHVVRLDLSSWDTAVVNKLLAKIATGTAGTLPTPGSLMGSGSLTYRLLLLTTNEPRNYPRAFLRNGVRKNHGTKFSRLSLEFECHGSTAGGGGTLYNATTS